MTSHMTNHMTSHMTAQLHKKPGGETLIYVYLSSIWTVNFKYEDNGTKFYKFHLWNYLVLILHGKKE
jgi:hypothetical protein